MSSSIYHTKKLSITHWSLGQHWTTIKNYYTVNTRHWTPQALSPNYNWHYVKLQGSNMMFSVRCSRWRRSDVCICNTYSLLKITDLVVEIHIWRFSNYNTIRVFAFLYKSTMSKCSDWTAFICSLYFFCYFISRKPESWIFHLDIWYFFWSY